MIATITGHTLTTATGIACQLRLHDALAAPLSVLHGAGTITLLVVVLMIACMAAIAGAAKLAASLIAQFLQAAANITSTLFTLVILAVVVVTLAVHH